MPALKLNPHFAGHRERLRRRFLSDVTTLPDYELLELLLTFAIPRRDVKPLAKALLARFGNLKAVLDAAPSDVQAVPGAGRGAATLLAALRAAMRVYFELEAKQTDLMNSYETVINYCRASLEGEKNEVFQILYLSSKNRLLGAERVAQGTIDRAAVFPRRVIEGALAARAAAMVFVHNHPSGDPTPSVEDRRLTRDLVDAAASVDILVHDHIVIGNGRHFSFRAAGLMDDKNKKI